ncbi:MAG: DNA recombination protein RmuC [Candidatus Zambryskibacteria bacterium CG10_big_fil_rev_8_21_14_0_10_42_12]|uniref:DNA recombination protein RmuC n=1 Tax=Candidatus Zambryskibacteria bacterium CG10_big_fil_rev_8_21_14_0_10_42_12 TaxID=1975115 RepID=A0A2H0QWN8_9BACT|nr:MAG: DNA recombination protein RmuC [Candidatus Zambryskibacteria bacterium CG10_big_fil_rev_8_21_14_0_10_42_12]
MDTLLIGLLVLLVVGNGFLIWRLIQRKEEKKDDTGFNLLLQHINDLSRTMDQKIGESAKEMNMSVRNQFSESSRLIKEITEELVRVVEGQRQVVSFADQLKDLQDILKNPKQRGILGEYYLETLLKNVLPPGSYQMQYGFADGTIVDAAVFVKDKIVPIDSKFSLENYNRLVSERDPVEKERLEKLFVNDLKLRIAETSKYIKPAEGTMDFAFMFIPHEAIYYDLLVNTIGALKEDTENLIQRAASKYKVIIVSPTSFLAYLQTVLQGLKALQIEETAKDIVKRIDELGKHLKAYEEYHGKLGNSLATTVNHFNSSHKEFRKIDKDVLRITGEAIDIEALALDKPAKDE